MKLLLDENLSPGLVERLADLYPGSIPVLGQGWGGSSDSALFIHAVAHEFVLVSHDTDFGGMTLLRGKSPKIILLRQGNMSTAETGRVLRTFHEQIEAFVQDPGRQLLELR